MIRGALMFGLFLVMPLVIIITLGNLLKRYSFISNSDVSMLGKILYWIILPPLLFRTTFIAGKELLRQPNLLIAVNICYILTIIVAWIGSVRFFHKDNIKRAAVSVFSDFRANNIYLGFPVVQLAMGETGLHLASIYIAVSTIFFQILSIGAGEVLLHGKISVKGFTEIIKRLLTNPLIIACTAGVGAAIFNVKIPFVIDSSMKLIGDSATAIALLSLGGTLDIPKIGNILKLVQRTWFDIIVKLAINPAIMWGVLFFLPVSKDLAQVTIMLSSMPCAVNCFIIAKGMGMDSEYAADLVASTTLLGVLSIPLWAHILGMV